MGKRKQEEEEEVISKRSHDEEPDDFQVFEDLQTGLTRDEDELNDRVNRQLFETQKQYYLAYMEKILNQNPMGTEIVNIVRNMTKENAFEYMFAAAKSIVQSQMRLKQIKAMHSVSDMLTGFVFRYLHENVVTPALAHVVNREQLKKAYDAYQKNALSPMESQELNLQLVTFCVQEMCEKKECIKVPNPLYTHLTQKFTAMSEYVTSLLSGLASVPEFPSEEPGRSEEIAISPLKNDG